MTETEKFPDRHYLFGKRSWKLWGYSAKARNADITVCQKETAEKSLVKNIQKHG